MNILLVMPDANIHKLRFGQRGISFREAPLTLTMLAALVPDECKASITCVDESVQPLPIKNGYNIVGISCLTGTSHRAYQLADSYRKAGATVILGGVHVTLRPEEAAKHADSIVIGFAEKSWPQLLKDFSSGSLKRIYQDTSPDLAGLPQPRRDLQYRFGYMTPYTVMATRGCKSSCDFCAVSAAKYGWQTFN